MIYSSSQARIGFVEGEVGKIQLSMKGKKRVGNVADLVSVQTGKDPSYATGKTSRRLEAEDAINVIPVTSRSPERGRLEQFPSLANADEADPSGLAAFQGTWRTPYCAAHIDDAAIYHQGLSVAVEEKFRYEAEPGAQWWPREVSYVVVAVQCGRRKDLPGFWFLVYRAGPLLSRSANT